MELDKNGLVEILELFLSQEFNFGTYEVGERWEGGKLILQPADTSLQSKEIELSVFFEKIIRIRENLRVLEQRINVHEKLTEEDKVNMQQYITKCYGTLTTFNVLFKNKGDYFVGAGKTPGSAKTTQNNQQTISKLQKKLGLNEY